MLLVRAPGSMAQLGDLRVTVLGVALRRASVLYEVAWVTDGCRHAEWVYDFELTGDGGELEVGFQG